MRAILIALLALQVMVMTPVTMAMSTTATSIASVDCDDHHGGANDECSCCPGVLATSGGCATLCLAAFALLPAATPLPLRATLFAVPGFGASRFASQTYPPVNPPPIR